MASRAFDAIGATYDEAFSDKPGQVAAGSWLLSHLHGDRAVLDVGCGSGLPTAGQLAAAGCTVVGVDTSPVMLELARKNVPTGIFVERDLFDLGGLHPAQGRFDGATAFFSLLMLRRTEIGKALDSIRSVLGHDGLFTVGMVEGDTDYLMREFLGVPVPLTAFPRDELQELLPRHGFTVVEFHSEHWEPATPDTEPQTHLYAYCRATPTM
ncbi:methyltransferase [Rhizocola hellebori]|uniref:Methyltransferase n=1 Tax=Rhizocola hellebori TaxID=1392758 RepID=A0A8J3QB38_9ACTN|nr:class I SAM-dependent methyltransferase [Rhizocola hellebori]GIH07291.1 methyltransferase [Rhizocola hellebori]